MTTFDPFGDHGTRGYLRNFAGENDTAVARRLEHHAFAANVLPALAALKIVTELGYEHILDTHRTLFRSVYPWAGQDRAALAPDVAIAKGGAVGLFAHPRDIRRAAGYALDWARDPATMRARPGLMFGALAYAHPFLEGHGRTLMTVQADLARRADFHIAWQGAGKEAFLAALTSELRQPGSAMDQLLEPQIRPGPLPTAQAARMRENPSLPPACR